jgi:hypothetical protein
MRFWLTGLLALTLYLEGAYGQDVGMENARSIQREQLERLQDFLGPPAPPVPALADHGLPPTPGKGSTITFKNPAAKKFFVDGTKIPDGINCTFFILLFYALILFARSQLRCWPLLVWVNAHLGS